MTGDVSPMRTALTRAGRTIRPSPTAPPIRQVLADRRDLVTTARQRAQSPLTTVRRYAVTSPGKLILILVLIAVMCVSAGFYASTTLEKRTETLREMIERTEPLAEASQVLYSSLSIADAAANSAFISGGLESPELRTRYSDALATASSSLIIAAGTSQEPGEDTTSAEKREINTDLQTLAISIPVYSGLVEVARTNNRLGNPVGSSYLGEASSLMQEKILPAAQRLYEQRSLAIADPQSALTVPPWGVYVALIVLIVALVATSRYLARRTRRRFNLGVLAALIAVVVGTVWLLASGLMSVAATNNARIDGADPLRELTSARILTQQARSAETLSLVRRGDQADLDRTFAQSTAEIGRTLDRIKSDRGDDESGPVTDAQLYNANFVLNQWKERDAQVRAQMSAGNFSQARVLTVGDGPNSTAKAYADLDRALVDNITITRKSFRDDINTAQRVLGYTGTGILMLTLFAAAAVVVGLIPRIREYR
ncbi:hypothetical protein QSJ19_11865 [Gordonia sp. ABSL11-1]|uniref:hypothetical protein n=1 Tax=Gordonia sp. ABSL11-1 TaxID=3053924 RepID=UPI002573A2D2|nr:hypothetical protein [Gordonia sp. ABSL11-1]MDL9946281.1 hypothetical protein [Gordonia sp. ABSL11-1]